MEGSGNSTSKDLSKKIEKQQVLINSIQTQVNSLSEKVDKAMTIEEFQKQMDNFMERFFSKRNFQVEDHGGAETSHSSSTNGDDGSIFSFHPAGRETINIIDNMEPTPVDSDSVSQNCSISSEDEDDDSLNFEFIIPSFLFDMDMDDLTKGESLPLEEVEKSDMKESTRMDLVGMEEVNCGKLVSLQVILHTTHTLSIADCFTISINSSCELFDPGKDSKIMKGFSYFVGDYELCSHINATGSFVLRVCLILLAKPNEEIIQELVLTNRYQSDGLFSETIASILANGSVINNVWMLFDKTPVSEAWNLSGVGDGFLLQLQLGKWTGVQRFGRHINHLVKGLVRESVCCYRLSWWVYQPTRGSIKLEFFAKIVGTQVKLLGMSYPTVFEGDGILLCQLWGLWHSLRNHYSWEEFPVKEVDVFVGIHIHIVRTLVGQEWCAFKLNQHFERQLKIPVSKKDKELVLQGDELKEHPTVSTMSVSKGRAEMDNILSYAYADLCKEDDRRQNTHVIAGNGDSLLMHIHPKRAPTSRSWVIIFNLVFTSNINPGLVFSGGNGTIAISNDGSATFINASQDGICEVYGHVYCWGTTTLCCYLTSQFSGQWTASLELICWRAYHMGFHWQCGFGLVMWVSPPLKLFL